MSTNLLTHLLGSSIRCSTNSMSYLFYSHHPSSLSSFAPQGNSNYHTLVNSVPSAHSASVLSLLACSTRAASGTMPIWVLQMGGRPCWTLFGWVRLVMFYSRTLMNSSISSSIPQDSHHHIRNFFCSIFSLSLFRLSSRLLHTKPPMRAQ